MNDTIVTVQGWLGSDPAVREAAGVPVANFRVACTPRRLRRSTGEWVDGPTQWYGVSAWRQLAEHCGRSLKRGDPVLLQGRLNQRTYVNRDNIEVTAMEIDLVSIGHDLSRGISVFNKTVGGAWAQQKREQEQARRAEQPEWATAGTEAAPSTDTMAPPEPEPGPGPETEADEDRVTAA